MGGVGNKTCQTTRVCITNQLQFPHLSGEVHLSNNAKVGYFLWHCLHLCKQWHDFFAPYMHVKQLEWKWFGPPHLVCWWSDRHLYYIIWYLYKSECNGKGLGLVRGLSRLRRVCKNPNGHAQIRTKWGVQCAVSHRPPASHSQPWKNIWLGARMLGWQPGGCTFSIHLDTILSPYTNTLRKQQSPYPWIGDGEIELYYPLLDYQWLSDYSGDSATTICHEFDASSCSQLTSQGCLDFIEILEREVLPQLSPQCQRPCLGRAMATVWKWSPLVGGKASKIFKIFKGLAFLWVSHGFWSVNMTHRKIWASQWVPGWSGSSM